MEQGERCFEFAVLLGTRSEIAARTDLRAQVMNEKPLAISFFADGDGQTLTDTVAVTGVRMDTMKKSEDGNAYILRLFNYHNAAQTATVEIPLLGQRFTAEFAPLEIKTLRADADGIREVHLLHEN